MRAFPETHLLSVFPHARGFRSADPATGILQEQQQLLLAQR